MKQAVTKTGTFIVYKMLFIHDTDLGSFCDR